MPAKIEIDPDKLVAAQKQAIAGFFGVDIQTPPDRLFVVAEKLRSEKLFKAEPFYLPRHTFPEGVTFPGQSVPMSPNLYRYMREKWVDADANSLPGMWVLLDVTKRPSYNGGKQIYPDSNRFKELLVGLRDRGDIQVPDYCRHVPKDSRFAVSADEIDGSGGFVVREVAAILGLEAGEVTTPLYSTVNYTGNLAHPEFGKVDTSERFANRFGRGGRLDGGSSGHGGLACVDGWLSDNHFGLIGFRLQVAFPSQAA